MSEPDTALTLHRASCRNCGPAMTHSRRRSPSTEWDEQGTVFLTLAPTHGSGMCYASKVLTFNLGSTS